MTKETTDEFVTNFRIKARISLSSPNPRTNVKRDDNSVSI